MCKWIQVWLFELSTACIIFQGFSCLIFEVLVSVTNTVIMMKYQWVMKVYIE